MTSSLTKPDAKKIDVIKASAIGLNGMSREQRYNFQMSPPEKGKLMQCTIIRDKKGFNRISPKYTLYISENMQFLLNSKKKTKAKTGYYGISMLENNFNKKEG
jgi:hypothetical protein